MGKTAWITAFGAGVCLAFAIGVAVGKGRKAEPVSLQPAMESRKKEGESDRVRALLASLENFRKALAEKEERVGELEAELAEVRAQLPAPLSPEEKEKQRQQEETRKQRERELALFSKARDLRRKIVQRKDKALRQAGAAELVKLIESADPEDQLLGLTTLFYLDGMKVGAERFRPQIFAAIQSQSPELRHAAVSCLSQAYPPEESFEMLLGMVHDPSPEVRDSAAFNLASICGEDPMEEVEGVLTSLLRDSDETVRRTSLIALSGMYGHYDEAQKAEKMESLAAELAADPQRAGEVLGWWEARYKLGPENTARLSEMLLSGDILVFGGEDSFSERTLNELFGSPLIANEGEFQPFISRVTLRVLKDSRDDELRRRALRMVRDSENRSLVPQLEEIAGSPNSAKIREDLAKTIEYLQEPRSLHSLKRYGLDEEPPAPVEGPGRVEETQEE